MQLVVVVTRTDRSALSWIALLSAWPLASAVRSSSSEERAIVYVTTVSDTLATSASRPKKTETLVRSGRRGRRRQ